MLLALGKQNNTSLEIDVITEHWGIFLGTIQNMNDSHSLLGACREITH